MVVKQHRLSRQKDFQRVFGRGKRLNSRFISVRVAPNGLNVFRFAIVVSNKVSKKATTRNKIRRQIREIIRVRLPNIKLGFDAVITVNSGILSHSFQEIKQAIDASFKKSGLLTND